MVIPRESLENTGAGSSENPRRPVADIYRVARALAITVEEFGRGNLGYSTVIGEIERMKAHDLLSRLGLPPRDSADRPDSSKRFPHGAQYRVEIPCVEDPCVLAAVLDEARIRAVTVHPVSHGSGIMLLTDSEITEMVEMRRETGIGLSLFVGSRAGWDTVATVTSSAGKSPGAQLRGKDQLAYALLDRGRPCHQ